MKLPGAGSLVGRLILLAAVWSLIVLAITGILLSAQFERASLSRLDNDLSALADALYSGTTIGGADEIVVPPFNDERFDRAYSGRYWQVAEIGPRGELTPRARSRSLFDARLAGPPGGIDALSAQAGHAVPYDARGPLEDQPLRAGALLARSLPGHPTPLVFMVAEDRSAIDRDIRTFATTTAVALILLGLFIIAGVWVQVRVGLQPLFRLSREVAQVRKGRADHVGEDYPAELSPLAEELNALVSHNQEVVERQRTHVGNLAHALKTPISVMMTEASSHPGQLADVVRRQSEAMNNHVEHHLRRARAAARSQTSRELTPIAPVIEELARTLERIFQDKGVSVAWAAPDDLAFQGERQDFLEIIGNVMENACKWCVAEVRVQARAAGESRVEIIVGDDGPGLPAEQRDEMLKRGARLDEKTPGTGLGLSIVDDLSKAYGGDISLGESDLGGLQVTLTLPRAET